MSVIQNEQELFEALTKVRHLGTPFFKGYCELFEKYLDLEKIPLAVQNIMIVEESWISFGIRETLLGYIMPSFSKSEETMQKLMKCVEKIAKKFNLRNTYIFVELWINQENFLVVEVNCR